MCVCVCVCVCVRVRMHVHEYWCGCTNASVPRHDSKKWDKVQFSQHSALHLRSSHIPAASKAAQLHTGHYNPTHA